jgi:hypothetical protein
MKSYEGVEVLLQHSWPRRFMYECSDWRAGRFTRWEVVPGTYWIWGCRAPQQVRTQWKREVLVPASNRISVVQPAGDVIPTELPGSCTIFYSKWPSDLRTKERKKIEARTTYCTVYIGESSLDDRSAQVFPYNIFTYCSICRVHRKFARNKKEVK